MPRGKGFRRRSCFCRVCGKGFKACREDAVTCSTKCRKTRNRLLGGKMVDVTEMLDASPIGETASGLSVTNAQGESRG